MGSNKTIKLGVIGIGSIFKTHYKAITSIKNAELVALCSRSEEKLHSEAEKLGVKAYRTVEEMVADPKIDAVIVLTPPYTHTDIGLKVARAGKHLLIEKPLDIDIEKAQQLVEECEKNNVILSVISQMRFGGAVQKAKRLIEHGTLGKLTLLRVSMKWNRSKKYYDSSSWITDSQKSGGGVLINQGIHFVDLLRWLGGPYTKVSSFKCTLKHTVPIEDTFVGMVQFKNNALGIIEATTTACRNLPNIIEVHGTNGSIVIKNNKIIEYHFGDYSLFNTIRSKLYSKIFSFIPLKKGHITDQITNFVSTINKEEKLFVPGSEGLDTLKLCRKLYENGT
ncbi:hypothetical protein COV17_03535 [Candidatus Woesearchaeota archaeon CG10_big_fil_rev_8_21_14_0_10_36_11]|nr:MAG: hypothetical protein COV17_03535 [Candidatus Woesearchaeota archaeon CG10_big_fil_rev_8_21_14_0_10_36_11]